MAVGRKIAVNLHRMWLEDRAFDPQMDVEEFLSTDDAEKHTEGHLTDKATKTKRNGKTKKIA